MAQSNWPGFGQDHDLTYFDKLETLIKIIHKAKTRLFENNCTTEQLLSLLQEALQHAQGTLEKRKNASSYFYYRHYLDIVELLKVKPDFEILEKIHQVWIGAERIRCVNSQCVTIFANIRKECLSKSKERKNNTPFDENAKHNIGSMFDQSTNTTLSDNCRGTPQNQSATNRNLEPVNQKSTENFLKNAVIKTPLQENLPHVNVRPKPKPKPIPIYMPVIYNDAAVPLLPSSQNNLLKGKRNK